MLTARTKSGDSLCLGYHYKKETLLKIRRQEEFFCPICGEGVVLKLGEQRIFHFAHKRISSCVDVYEKESVQHMEGKQQLFQWLIKQKIPAVLEYYDKEIQQRPDIMFTYHDRKYALEFQCSTIPEVLFSKRTAAYQENGYTPLWILSSSHLHEKRRAIMEISNFHYLFLRRSTSGSLYIPTYCPDNQQFQFVQFIRPYSIKNALIQRSFPLIKYMTIDNLLEPKQNTNLRIKDWKAELNIFVINWMQHPQPKQMKFLQEIYNRGLNFFLLPPEIGLPVTHSSLIQTPPIIWQTYLFLDIFALKKVSDFISFQEIKAHVNKRIYRNDIQIRRLPQLEPFNPLLPIMEYLQILEQLKVIQQKGTAGFQLLTKITVPKSNREKEEALVLFYQNYRLLFN